MARQQRKPPARRRRTWRRDRAGKQKNLIRAFDRVLHDKGVQGLGVNAVIKEAGVGKNLLYKYFGDLKGLARAWGRTTELLPGESEIAGDDKRAYARLSTPEQISRNYRQYAAALRRRPRTLEILANELVHPNVLTAPLDDVRGDLGKALEKYFTRPQEYARNDTVAIMVIMLAAVTYLALRSRTAPQYLWMRLDTERGWREADQMIDLIIKRVLGAGASAKASAKPTTRAGARAAAKVSARASARTSARTSASTRGRNGARTHAPRAKGRALNA